MMSKLKILVVTHKQYEFTAENCYFPIQVGKELSSTDLAILADNSGEHISAKNKSFCELTALYWAWKNDFFDNADYIGLVHYRRYFSGNGSKLKQKCIASENELLAILERYDGIVPKKRNYYIETVYDHYKNAHFIKDLDLIKQIIAKEHSDYLSAFDKVMSGKTLHLFNMFVLKKEYLVAYCNWLFPILFKLENRIDISCYDNYQQRVFGFLSERLFNVWLEKNKLHLKQLPVVSLEGENLLKKAYNLIKRKYLIRFYD